ncbi:MAG: hypothetical protein ACJA0Y_002228 [Maricaulis maris]|jgi:hypothetical protein
MALFLAAAVFVFWAVLTSAAREVGVFATVLTITISWYFAHAVVLGIYRSRGRAVLALNEFGFEERHLTRTRQIRWDDCSEFRVWNIGGSRMIVFNNAAKKNGLYRKLTARLSKHNDWIEVPLPEPLEGVSDRLNAARSARLSASRS